MSKYYAFHQNCQERHGTENDYEEHLCVAAKWCVGLGFCCATLRAVRVFGVDCGTQITGFGVVETGEQKRGPELICKAMGGIRLSKLKSLPERLEQVFRELTEQMARWEPDAVSVEGVFYSVNAKSALKLGHVRGVALLAAAMLKLPVFEYARRDVEGDLAPLLFAINRIQVDRRTG